MAGHSKFKNIMYRKGAQDAKRAKLFTKLGREIIVAAKEGGPEPEMNPRLRNAIVTARKQSMPNDRINKAIDTATGEGEGDSYEPMRYEGYGPGGVAIIVDALTDNKNRTAGEVRACFTKYSGNLGETGCVNFMFDQVGEVVFKGDKATPEEMFEAAVEAGASDCESDDMHTVYCAPDDFAVVRDTLESRYGEPERAGLVWKPNTMTELSEDQAGSLLKLIDALEDSDDVQHVTTNFEVSDEIMERLMA